MGENNINFWKIEPTANGCDYNKEKINNKQSIKRDQFYFLILFFQQ